MRHHAAMFMHVTVGPRTPVLPSRAALVPRGQHQPLGALETLLGFRAAAYAAVGRRADAETSPEGGFSPHSSRHSNGQPIVAGWSFQWLAQLSLTRDSWTAPLSVRRVPPGTNVNEAAARQIRELVARRPADGQLPLF